jgi:hypothetical protein
MNVKNSNVKDFVGGWKMHMCVMCVVKKKREANFKCLKLKTQKKNLIFFHPHTLRLLFNLITF